MYGCVYRVLAPLIRCTNVFVLRLPFHRGWVEGPIGSSLVNPNPNPNPYPYPNTKGTIGNSSAGWGTVCVTSCTTLYTRTPFSPTTSKYVY